MPFLGRSHPLAMSLALLACRAHTVVAPPPESPPGAVLGDAVPATSTPDALSQAPRVPVDSMKIADVPDAGAEDAAPIAKTDTIGQALSLQANLTFVDTLVGAGREAQEGDHVSLHCVGTLQDGTVFESSRVKKRPLAFVAGGDKVVMGLSEGVVGMRVGGRRTLTVPPALGYGRRGSGAKVPPSAVLTFEVELLSVK